MRVAVVIPCYRVARHIAGVVKGLPELVDHIVVVDDACPDSSGQVAAKTGDPRVEVIRHPANQGVGAAMATGYRRALELGAEVVVKMDGDGQMDPAELPRLLAPVLAGRVDYAKGNRFRHRAQLRTMPTVRLLGNSVLSFLVKAASGQWSVMDPTNGYTAITARALGELDLDRLSPRYFFESDVLIRLGTLGLPVEDVAIPARYGDEQSSLSVGNALAQFPPLLLKGFLRRVALRYFLEDFNIASLYLLAGLPLLLFGTLLGLEQWAESVATGVVRSAGTVMLAAMPVIVGLQLLLQAIAYDVAATPKPRGV